MVEIEDRWAALQFDNAVCLVGLALENASQEREQVGEGSDISWRNKYSMRDLLDSNFKLPSSESPGIEDDSVFAGMEGLLYDVVS